VVETLDWSAGEILRELKTRGLDERTLVVFASDNGPWHHLPPRMLQKGNEPWHTGTKGLLRGSKGNTCEGGQRVPCIVRWPGVVPPRQICADIVSTLDILPTCVAAAGARLPGDRVYDGFDVGEVLRGKKPSPRSTFHYFRGRTLEAIREGSWKFRFAPPPAGEEEKPSGAAAPELFNLDLDPAEQYNVYERERARGDAMMRKMQAFAAELKTETRIKAGA
jgi:arylsulfatase A-like enzyme